MANGTIIAIIYDNMSPGQVRGIIEAEIGEDWSPSNLHGVDLKRCLVLPSKRVYEDSFAEGGLIELWLVLEETPGNPASGYCIVFDEESGDFGLAVAGHDKDVFIGFYGSFLETLRGM